MEGGGCWVRRCAHVEDVEFAVGGHAADDAVFVRRELRAIGTRMGRDAKNGHGLAWLKDFDSPVPARRQKAGFGQKVELDAKHFLAVLEPLVDGRAGDGGVEEFDGPVTAAGEEVVGVHFGPADVVEDVLCVPEGLDADALGAELEDP